MPGTASEPTDQKVEVEVVIVEGWSIGTLHSVKKLSVLSLACEVHSLSCRTT